MGKNRKSIELHTDTYDRLRSFKQGKTFDELIRMWLDHFEGTNNSKDEVRYITNGDWDELIQRVGRLEDKESR